MAYDGSIRINTRIDGKGFNTGIKAMLASLGSLAAAIGVALSVQQLVQFGKTGVKTAMEMEAGWQGLRYMANAYGKDLGHIKEFLNEFTEDGLVPMMNAQQAYKNMLARGYSTDQLEKMLLIMKDSSVYLRKGQLDIGEAIEKTTMGLRTERSILTDSAGIEKNMYKMWQAYAKEMGTTISALTHEQKLIAEFQGFMEEGAVYAGAAAEYTQTYAGKVAQLTAAMVSLKVSVGNMLIPLLNAILPKIIAMVKWFTYWFNIIGRVLNLLFGTQVGAIDAIADGTEDAVEAQEDLANATGEAGKAAKGALASFDKLNVLAQPTPASGGGEGGNIGLPVQEEGLFPELGEELDALDQKLAAFKEKLLAFFAPLKEPFERLKEAFLTLGQTIWTGLGWAWENILLPFLKWIVQSVSPLALDIIAGVLTVLNEILIAISPLLTWLWEEILQPLGQWAGEKFIQALTWIVEKLTELSTWISEHQELVQNIALLIGSIALVIGVLSVALGIYNVVAGIATAITAAFSSGLAATILILGGIMLAIIALGVGVYLLIKNWDAVKEALSGVAAWFSEHIVEPLKQAWDHIKEKLAELTEFISKEVVEPIKEKLGKLFTALKELWDVIAPWLKTALDWIGTAFDVAFAWWRGLFTGVWDAIIGVLRGAFEIIGAVIGAVIDVIAGIITFLTGVFTGDWDKAWQGIKDIVLGIWDGIVGVIKGAINGIIGFINGMINGIVSGINNVIGVLNKLKIEIPDWIPLIGGKTFGFNITPLTAPQIPLLATGAVIPANAPFAAILGDQKSGTNIEAPLKTIEQAVDNVLARRGINTGADSGTIHNVIKLDGQVLYDAFKKIDKRVGKSLLAGSGIR